MDSFKTPASLCDKTINCNGSCVKKEKNSVGGVNIGGAYELFCTLWTNLKITVFYLEFRQKYWNSLKNSTNDEKVMAIGNKKNFKNCIMDLSNISPFVNEYISKCNKS